MDIFNEIWTALCDLVTEVLSTLVDILPDSPFSMLDNSPIVEYLPYINYFVDFGFILSTLSLWLIAVIGYYTYSVLLRWLKAID